MEKIDFVLISHQIRISAGFFLKVWDKSRTFFLKLRDFFLNCGNPAIPQGRCSPDTSTLHFYLHPNTLTTYITLRPPFYLPIYPMGSPLPSRHPPPQTLNHCGSTSAVQTATITTMLHTAARKFVSLPFKPYEIENT